MKKLSQKCFAVLSIFALLMPYSSVSAMWLNENRDTKEINKGVVVDTEVPEIFSADIQNKREYDGAVVVLSGKNFGITGHSTATVTFSTTDEGTTTVSSFRYHSPTSLIFPLPTKLAAGNIYVTVKDDSGADSKTSKPFFFDFHPPEILFITGDDGIAPGKKVKIWGNYFDGVYYRNNGRSERAEIQNGKLSGTNSARANGNFSVIEMTLPKDSFQEEIWVERNCDEKGEHCLKSNTVTMENLFPPILTNIHVDYVRRTATVTGKNFPVNKSDFAVMFNGKSQSISEYSGKDGHFTFSLPCPLPISANVYVEFKGVKSNALKFAPKSTPYLSKITLEQDEDQSGSYFYFVAIDNNFSVPNTSACDATPTLKIAGKSYELRKSGSKYKTIQSGEIPEEKVLAHVVLGGVESNVISVDFSQDAYVERPLIYNIEGKYGFRPGVPFTIYGRNLGNHYKSCGKGETVFNGPEVVYERQDEQSTGAKTQSGDRIRTSVCIPNPPKVRPNYMELQFLPLEYGATPPKESPQKVSVTVGGVKSNEIEIPFGSRKNNVAQAAPTITRIEYPEGYTPGSKILIYGYQFGKQVKLNRLYFGDEEMEIVSVNKKGTYMEAILPKSETGGNVSLYRTSPNPQESNETRITISPYEKQELSFTSPESQKNETLEFFDKETEFSTSEWYVNNSLEDLQINTFVVQMQWKDGDEEAEYSVKKIKNAPFTTFSLLLNGSEVATAIPNVGKNNISLEFTPFSLPLSEKKEPFRFSITSAVLPFATDKSSFSFSFTPTKRKNFLAKGLQSGKVITQQKISKEIIYFDSFSVSKGSDNTCIDVREDNANCLAYMQMMGKNIAYHAEKTAVRAKEFAHKSTKTLATVPSISRHVKQHTQNAHVLHIQPKYSATKNRILTTLPAKKAQKVFAILQKQKKKNTKKSSKKSSSTTLYAAASEKKSVAFSKKQILQKLSPAQILRTKRLDTDHDGLSDAEEFLIGTNLSLSDTDRDGDSDFVEVEFGHSPFLRNGTKIADDIEDAQENTGMYARLILFGVFDGFLTDSKVFPNQSVTKILFATALVRTFSPANIPSPSVSHFHDIRKDDWFSPYIFALQEKNIHLAESDTIFAPFSPLSREEACAYTLRFLGEDIPSFVPENLLFSDVSAIYRGEVAECAKKKLLLPISKNEDEFGAKEHITRAELSRLLYKTVMRYR